MLSTNQIAVFFYHQYLWMELIDTLDFLHGDSYQGTVGSETTTFGCFWLDVLLVQSDYRILWSYFLFKVNWYLTLRTLIFTEVNFWQIDFRVDFAGFLLNPRNFSLQNAREIFVEIFLTCFQFLKGKSCFSTLWITDEGELYWFCYLTSSIILQNLLFPLYYHTRHKHDISRNHEFTLIALMKSQCYFSIFTHNLLNSS